MGPTDTLPVVSGCGFVCTCLGITVNKILSPVVKQYRTIVIGSSDKWLKPREMSSVVSNKIENKFGYVGACICANQNAWDIVHP